MSEIFIRRPVGTTLLTLGLMLGGFLAYGQLPVSALPQVDFPTLVVSTLLPGASATTIAATVTTPLERQLGQVPSLRQMTSVSSFGASQITLQFGLERSLDGAEQDVQAALTAASNLLPKTLPAPPTYTKSNPADAPILTLSISSPTRPIFEVHDYADSVMAQKISQVSGVGLVTLAGSQKPAVRVQVDPEALAHSGLTLEDVRSALVAANVNGPKGVLEGLRQSWSVSSDDQLTQAKSYGPLIIAYRHGAALRLQDVAQVSQGVENTELAAWADGQRAILLQVQRQPGANIIAVTQQVRALVAHLQTGAPQGTHIRILADRTRITESSLHDVQWTLALTVLLVVAVILIFLQNLRATLIPAVTVPLSILGTLTAMYFLDFSLDNLSLMALTVSTGFVVDDAIVMVENIARRIDAGASPIQAAITGARQMAFTIVSLTISMIAVLVPLLFMGGVIGRLFFAFSLTLAAAIGVSAVLSLTLTPMMSATLLRAHVPGQKAAVAQAFEQAFARITASYGRGLDWVLARQGLTLALTWATLALTLALAWAIPKGFFPQADTGLLLGVSVAGPDISFARMSEKQQGLAQALRADPDVAHVASFIGSDGTNPTLHSGRLQITLVPQASRSGPLAATLARLAAAALPLPGISLYLKPVQDLQLDSRPSRTQFQYTLEDADADELAHWAGRLQTAMAALPELTDVATDAGELGQAVGLSIDRDAANRLGVTVQGIDDTLYDAYGQRFVSTIYTQLNQYRVILEVQEPFARDAHALEHLFVPSSTGTPVPLTRVAAVSSVLAPLTINHQSQFPAVTLSFNLAGRASLSRATAAIAQAQTNLGMPPGVRAAFTGTAQAFGESLAREPPLIAAALAVVYVVLGVLYESAIHPITILSTLPSAGVGALIALALTGCQFDMMALIGVVLLIGIVKKNAIMMIDVALELERDDNLPALGAIRAACLLRFRPIMMTTCAAMLGALPLSLGLGVGGEMRQPMGVAIVGGLLISQLLTLFTTPVVYLAMGRLGGRLALLGGRAQPPAPASARP